MRSILVASMFSACTASSTDANLYLELNSQTLETARLAVQRALETRETGDRETWSVAGVARGTVSPLRTWRSTSGHWCREFEETVRLADGRTDAAIGIRCRQSDGRWLLAKS